MKRLLLCILSTVVSAVAQLSISSPFFVGGVLKVPGAAAPTEVDQLSGLFAWYQSDSLVTNIIDVSPPTEGDQIKTWGDKSGNGRHLGIILLNPQWEANVKGSLAGMEFGTTEGLRVGFSAQADTTIFLIWNMPGGSFLIPQDSTNSAARHAVYKGSGDVFTITSGTVQNVGTAVPGNWYIIGAVFNSGGNDSVYTNGVAASTSLGSGSQSLDGLTIGGANDNTLNPGANRWIGEVVIYNRNLSSTEIGQVFTILNTRWTVY